MNDDYARFLELLGERRPQSWADIAEVSTAVAQMRRHDGLLTQEDFDSTGSITVRRTLSNSSAHDSRRIRRHRSAAPSCAEPL